MRCRAGPAAVAEIGVRPGDPRVAGGGPNVRSPMPTSRLENVKRVSCRAGAEIIDLGAQTLGSGLRAVRGRRPGMGGAMDVAVRTVDYHTGGEPFRIVPHPPVEIGGAT